MSILDLKEAKQLTKPQLIEAYGELANHITALEKCRTEDARNYRKLHTELEDAKKFAKINVKRQEKIEQAIQTIAALNYPTAIIGCEPGGVWRDPSYPVAPQEPEPEGLVLLRHLYALNSNQG